jgi:hypothetical protein
MINQVLLSIASVLTAIWGIAHLFATRGVVQGFGSISQDNTRIITMEWIVEGVALISIAAFVGVVTIIDPHSIAATGVYLVSAISLVVLASVSLFTGFKVHFLPYRLCPFIFGLSAALIVWGGLF